MDGHDHGAQTQPDDAVDVSTGEEFAFLEVIGEVVTRRSDKRRVQQRFVYLARKVQWDSNFAHGCGTDVIVVRQNWHGDRMVGKIFTPRIRPDWSPCNEKGIGEGGGAWRLRVYLGECYEYLHKIAAFAFHRRRVPEGMGWSTFKDEFEGDHLVFMDPHGRLQTRPEWVAAGWVEAVPKSMHRRRSTQLAAARRIEDHADRLERGAATPQQPGQPGPPSASVLEVIERAREHRYAWSTLVGDLDVEPTGLDESEIPSPNLLQSHEVGIGLWRDRRSAAAAAVILGNPFVRFVLRRQPSGREARRELIAYSCCVALQQSGLEVPGVPVVLQRC